MNFNKVEINVLKAVCFSRKNALEFIDICDSKYFSPDLWHFVNTIIGYIKLYREPPTLNVLKDRAQKTNENLIPYIEECWREIDKSQFDISEFKYELEKLKKQFAAKEIISLKEKLNKAEDAGADISKLSTDLSKTLDTIRSSGKVKTCERKTVKEYLNEFRSSFQEKKKNPGLKAGIKTGFSFFDWATGGVKPSDFVLVAGETGHGKSTVLMNMARNIWMGTNSIDMTELSEGKNVVYFSLEMPYENCFIRLLASLSKVPYKKIETASVNKEEFARLKQALEFMHRYQNNFDIVDIPRLAKPSDIEGIVSEIVEDRKLDAIFVDYLGIMHPNSDDSDQDWLKQSMVAYELREIARAYNVPIFSAAQLNRKGQKKDGEEISIDRLSRSAGITTHCTAVLMLEKRKNEHLFGDMIIHLLKNRHGSLGKGRAIKHLEFSLLEDDPIDVSSENTVQNQDDISDTIEDIDFEEV
jgi:replicative DNA helicase